MNRILYACIAAAAITCNIHAMNQLALRAAPSLTIKSTQLLHKQWYTPITSCIEKRKNSSLTEPDSNSFMTQWNQLLIAENYAKLHQFVLRTQHISQEDLQQGTCTLLQAKERYNLLLQRRKLCIGGIFMGTACVTGGVSNIVFPCINAPNLPLELMEFSASTLIALCGIAAIEGYSEKYCIGKPTSTVKNNLSAIDAIEQLIARKQKFNNE
ncbi:MAG: hypothetical protein WCE21_05420 [Candidatus Babeliales bacterium]